MDQRLPSPKQGLNVVVTKGPGEPSVEVPHEELTGPTVPVLIAHTEVDAWVRAMQGAIKQLADECQMPQRDMALVAVQRAIKGFNEACAALVDKVFELEVLE